MVDYTVQPTMPAVQSATVREICYRYYGQLVKWKIYSKKRKQMKAHGKWKNEFWDLIGYETHSPWDTSTFCSPAVYSAVFPEPVETPKREKKETWTVSDWRLGFREEVVSIIKFKSLNQHLLTQIFRCANMNIVIPP